MGLIMGDKRLGKLFGGSTLTAVNMKMGWSETEDPDECLQMAVLNYYYIIL